MSCYDKLSICNIPVPLNLQLTIKRHSIIKCAIICANCCKYCGESHSRISKYSDSSLSIFHIIPVFPLAVALCVLCPEFSTIDPCTREIHHKHSLSLLPSQLRRLQGGQGLNQSYSHNLCQLASKYPCSKHVQYISIDRNLTMLFDFSRKRLPAHLLPVSRC